MNITGQSLIGFRTASEGGTTFRAVNPATGEHLEPPFVSVTPAGIDAAVELAREAFTEYGRKSGAAKAALLQRIAENLESASGIIMRRAHQETALPDLRLQSEMARTCHQLRLFADLLLEGSWVDARIDHSDIQRKPAPKPDIRSMLRPLGPVAVFGSSNFPLAFSVAGGDTASALAAGCPVIVKAHPAHPGTSELTGRAVSLAIRELALPEGVFSLLFDAGYDAGIRLVRHSGVRAVGFTGSRKGGLALAQAATSRPEPIPVYAEMGSINPVFVLPGALRERMNEIAAGLHASATLGVGQFCTNPGLVFVQAGEEAQNFLRELARRMNDTPPGAMLTAGICEAYAAGVDRMAAVNAVEVRARVPAIRHDGVLEGGAALLVTDAETFLSHPSLMDEVFGPSTLVVLCTGSTQFSALAEKLEGQLTASFHGTEEECAAHAELIALLEAKAGRLIMNGFPTGVEVGHAMVHGGPFPATSDGRSTSVGTRAIRRFTRPVCFQNFDDALLPEELRNSNPARIWRLVDGEWRK